MSNPLINALVQEELARIGYYNQQEVAGRGGRRFGRALAAIGTLGMSEAAMRRGRHVGAQRARNNMQREQQQMMDMDEDEVALAVDARVAATIAAQKVQQSQLGFPPDGSLQGFFGINDVVVPALGGNTSQSSAQEPTQLHRIILDAYDPTATITPSEAAQWLRITDIKVGTQSMFNNVATMTLGALTNNATVARIMSRIITPGVDLSIVFRNVHPTLAITVGGTGLGPNS